MKTLLIFPIIIFGVVNVSLAQDPHFSQFFMAPSLLNPAITGTTNEQWLISTNMRHQWSNAGTPFKSYAASADVKMLGSATSANTLGLSICNLYDQSLMGSFKSNYLQSTLSYHQKVGEFHQVGVGISGAYGQRRINYDNLTFGEQFSSGGFDITLPTGEAALNNMKSFFSLSTGILYSYTSEIINVQSGFSVFNVNKPKQSFLNDDRQILPIRYVGHVNAQYSFSDLLLLYLNAAYQRQAIQQYLSIGGATGIDLSNGTRENILFTGVWFRNADAVYPYVGIKIGQTQFGLSYDFTISKQNKGPQTPRSIELSILFRPKQTIPGVIPCPWR